MANAQKEDMGVPKDGHTSPTQTLGPKKGEIHMIHPYPIIVLYLLSHGDERPWVFSAHPLLPTPLGHAGEPDRHTTSKQLLHPSQGGGISLGEVMHAHF